MTTHATGGSPKSNLDPLADLDALLDAPEQITEASLVPGAPPVPDLLEDLDRLLTAAHSNKPVAAVRPALTLVPKPKAIEAGRGASLCKEESKAPAVQLAASEPPRAHPRHRLLPASIDYASVRPRYSDSGEDFYNFMDPLGNARASSRVAAETLALEIKFQRARRHGTETARVQRTTKNYDQLRAEAVELVEAGDLDLRPLIHGMDIVRCGIEGDPLIASPLVDHIKDPIARGNYLLRREHVEGTVDGVREMLRTITECANLAASTQVVQARIEATNRRANEPQSYPASYVGSMGELTTLLCEFYDKIEAMKEAYGAGIKPKLPGASDMPVRALQAVLKCAVSMYKTRDLVTDPERLSDCVRGLEYCLNHGPVNNVIAAHHYLSSEGRVLRDMDCMQNNCWGVLAHVVLQSTCRFIGAVYSACEVLPPSTDTHAICAARGRLVTMYRHVENLLMSPIIRALPHEDGIYRSYDAR